MSLNISNTAKQLRNAIERAQSSQADIPWLPRFPVKCCNFTSNLLVIALADAGVSQLRRMIGTVTDQRGDDVASHVWVEADQHVVDITADGHGQAGVIVAESSEWHSSLNDVKPFIERIDVAEGISAEEQQRLRDLYQDTLNTLAEYSGHTPDE